MEARKLAIISGLYANTNLDDGKKTRTKMITEIDENFQEAVIKLYESKSEEDMKIDKDDPFFSALNVPGSDIDWTKEENRVVTDLDQDLEPIEVDQN